jgi:glucokinase
VRHVVTPQVQALPRTDVAGIDSGGTKTYMLYKDPASGQFGELQVRSADHDSLEEVLGHCFLLANCLPRSLVIGAAGRPKRNGDVRITNHPQWPTFLRDAFIGYLHIEVAVVNDMVAMLAGLANVSGLDCEAVTAGVPPSSNEAKLAVAVGTGVGGAYMDSVGGKHASEAGHMSWQAVTALEVDYLNFLQRLSPGLTISVEWSIGGMRGIGHMYDFMSGRKKPGPYIQERVRRYRREGRGIGPVVTAAAVEGDGCCREVIRLFGGILGQFLRDMAVSSLSSGGSVWLAGGVLQAPGLRDILVEDSSFLDRFLCTGAEHADLLQEIPIYLVPDRQVTVRGALAMACSQA